MTAWFSPLARLAVSTVKMGDHHQVDHIGVHRVVSLKIQWAVKQTRSVIHLPTVSYVQRMFGKLISHELLPIKRRKGGVHLKH